MGVLEQEAGKRARNTQLQRAILLTAERFLQLNTEAMAGSVYRMFKLRDQHERERKYRSMLTARRRLLGRGLLRRNGCFVELTDKGRKLLSAWKRSEYQIPQPVKWDGKWRVLIFDIPEYRKRLRDKLRATLYAVGFKRLQDSVWVYPFDCEDFVTLLKADFKIGKDLLYLIAEGLENDAALRDYFEVYTP